MAYLPYSPLRRQQAEDTENATSYANPILSPQPGTQGDYNRISVNPEADFMLGLTSTGEGLSSGGLRRDSDYVQADMEAAFARGDAEAGINFQNEMLNLRNRADEIDEGTVYPRVASVADVENTGDFIDYAQQGFGSLIRTMAPSIAAGVPAGIAGTLAGGPVVGVAAGLAAGAAVQFPMEAGEQASSQHADPEILNNVPVLDRIHSQNVYGATASAIENIPLIGVMGSRVLFKPLSKALAKGITERTAKRALSRTRTVALESQSEGLVELSQAYAGQQQLNKLNPNRDRSHDKMEMIDSYLTAMMGLGGISVATTAPGYAAEKLSGRKAKADQAALPANAIPVDEITGGSDVAVADDKLYSRPSEEDYLKSPEGQAELARQQQALGLSTEESIDDGFRPFKELEAGPTYNEQIAQSPQRGIVQRESDPNEFETGQFSTPVPDADQDDLFGRQDIAQPLPTGAVAEDAYQTKGTVSVLTVQDSRDILEAADNPALITDRTLQKAGELLGTPNAQEAPQNVLDAAAKIIEQEAIRTGRPFGTERTLSIKEKAAIAQAKKRGEKPFRQAGDLGQSDLFGADLVNEKAADTRPEARVAPEFLEKTDTTSGAGTAALKGLMFEMFDPKTGEIRANLKPHQIKKYKERGVQILQENFPEVFADRAEALANRRPKGTRRIKRQKLDLAEETTSDQIWDAFYDEVAAQTEEQGFGKETGGSSPSGELPTQMLDDRNVVDEGQSNTAGERLQELTNISGAQQKGRIHPLKDEEVPWLLNRMLSEGRITKDVVNSFDVQPLGDYYLEKYASQSSRQRKIELDNAVKAIKRDIQARITKQWEEIHKKPLEKSRRVPVIAELEAQRAVMEGSRTNRYKLNTYVMALGSPADTVGASSQLQKEARAVIDKETKETKKSVGERVVRLIPKSRPLSSVKFTTDDLARIGWRENPSEVKVSKQRAIALGLSALWATGLFTGLRDPVTNELVTGQNDVLRALRQFEVEAKATDATKESIYVLQAEIKDLEKQLLPKNLAKLMDLDSDRVLKITSGIANLEANGNNPEQLAYLKQILKDGGDKEAVAEIKADIKKDLKEAQNKLAKLKRTFTDNESSFFAGEFKDTETAHTKKEPYTGSAGGQTSELSLTDEGKAAELARDKDAETLLRLKRAEEKIDYSKKMEWSVLKRLNALSKEAARIWQDQTGAGTRYTVIEKTTIDKVTAEQELKMLEQIAGDNAWLPKGKELTKWKNGNKAKDIAGLMDSDRKTEQYNTAMEKAKGLYDDIVANNKVRLQYLETQAKVLKQIKEGASRISLTTIESNALRKTLRAKGFKKTTHVGNNLIWERVTKKKGPPLPGVQQPRSLVTKEAKIPQGAERINIWAGDNQNTILSNLAPRPFKYDGQQYNSVEHAYQTLKSGSFDRVLYDAYRNPAETRRKIRGKPVNRKISLQLMEDLVRSSFAQNPKAQKALLATGDAFLTHVQDTTIWKTKFPEVLMKVRSELQAKNVIPPVAVDNKDIKVTKVISGGQNGADVGGLLAAKKLGIETGGTAPPGFKTSTGKKPQLAKLFGMVEGEPDPAVFPKRTMKNVDDADATIAYMYKPSPGTGKTIGYAQTGKWNYGKNETTYEGHRPVLVLTNKDPQATIAQIREFLAKTKAKTINIAGHRNATGFVQGYNQFVQETLIGALTGVPPTASVGNTGATWAKKNATQLKSFFTRQSVENDPDSLYLFTDNLNRTSGNNPVIDTSAYAAKHGTGKKYPGMTQAVIRGLDNALPITTMRNQYRGQWTAGHLIQFKKVISEEIAAIKEALPNYPNGLKIGPGKIGQGSHSSLPANLQEYLDKRLLEIGINQKTPKKAGPPLPGVPKDDSVYSPMIQLTDKERIKLAFSKPTKENIQKALQATFDKQTYSLLTFDGKPIREGLAGSYSQVNDEVNIYPENIDTIATAIWTAWHELYHRGGRLQHNIGRKTYEEKPRVHRPNDTISYTRAMEDVLRRASTNKTVDTIVGYMITERGTSGLLAVEEALVEIGAAVETGAWNVLEQRYKIKASAGLKGELTKLFKEWLGNVRKLLALQNSSATDAEVFEIVKTFQEKLSAPGAYEHHVADPKQFAKLPGKPAIPNSTQQVRLGKNLRKQNKVLTFNENTQQYEVIDRQGRLDLEETRKLQKTLPTGIDSNYVDLEQALKNPDLKAKQEAVVKYLTRAHGKEFKKSIEFLLKKDTLAEGGFEGSFYNDIIQIAIDSMDPLSVAFHESMHKFAAALQTTDIGQDLHRRLEKAASAPFMRKQLKELLKDHPQKQDQLTDVNERISYMFQFWAASKQVGGPVFKIHNSRNILEHVIQALARITGVITHSAASEKIFEALYSGSFHETGVNPLAQYKSKEVKEIIAHVYGSLRGGISSVFSTPVTRVKNFKIPALTELMNRWYSDVLEEQGSGAMQKGQQVDRQYRVEFIGLLQKHKITPSTLKEANDNISAMKKPSTAFEKDYKQLMNKLYAYSQDGEHKVLRFDGIDPDTHLPVWSKMEKEKYAKKGHLWGPRIWSIENILANEKTFRARMKEHGDLDTETIDQFIENIRHSDGAVEQAYRAEFSPFMSSVNKRVFEFITPENAADFVEFQEQDLVKKTTGYIRGLAHRKEHAAAFGSKGEITTKLLDKAKTQGATDEQIKLTEKAIQGLEGRLGTDKVSDMQRNSMVTAMSIVNFAVLPLALFSSLVDPLGVLVRTGSLKGAAATFAAGARQIVNDSRGKSSGELQELAEYIGSIENDMAMNIMNNTEEGIFMNEKLRKLNSFFFKAIGLEQWTRGTRIGALGASITYLAKNKDNSKALAELGLQKGDIQLLKSEEGNDRIRIRMSEFTGGDRATSRAQARRVHNALYRLIDESILRPSAGTRPLWMSDQRFLLLGHLKQFTFTYHNTIVRQVTKRMNDAHANGENWAQASLALAPLLAYVPVMMAADMLRDMAAGKWDDDDDEKSFTESFGRALQRSTIFGNSTFLLDLQDDLDYGSLPVNTILGPVAEKGFSLANGILDPDASATTAFKNLLPGSAMWKNWGDGK